jgi:glycopeptide antibiotics resistance protein
LKKSIIAATAFSILLIMIFSPILIKLTYYLNPIVLVAVFLCIWGGVSFLVLLIRNETVILTYYLFKWILGLYTLILLILLFIRPNEQIYHSSNLIPFRTITFYLSGNVNILVAFYNLVANIILFVPYGIFLMTKKDKNFSFMYLFLPLTSICLIECLQYLTHRGSLDIDDLLLNMSGIFIGYLVFPILNRVIKIL